MHIKASEKQQRQNEVCWQNMGSLIQIASVEFCEEFQWSTSCMV